MIQLISNTLNKTLLKLLTQTPETFCFHSRFLSQFHLPGMDRAEQNSI